MLEFHPHHDGHAFTDHHHDDGHHDTIHHHGGHDDHFGAHALSGVSIDEAKGPCPELGWPRVDMSFLQRLQLNQLGNEDSWFKGLWTAAIRGHCDDFVHGVRGHYYDHDAAKEWAATHLTNDVTHFAKTHHALEIYAAKSGPVGRQVFEDLLAQYDAGHPSMHHDHDHHHDHDQQQDQQQDHNDLMLPASAADDQGTHPVSMFAYDLSADNSHFLTKLLIHDKFMRGLYLAGSQDDMFILTRKLHSFKRMVMWDHDAALAWAKRHAAEARHSTFSRSLLENKIRQNVWNDNIAFWKELLDLTNVQH